MKIEIKMKKEKKKREGKKEKEKKKERKKKGEREVFKLLMVTNPAQFIAAPLERETRRGVAICAKSFIIELKTPSASTGREIT